MTISADANLERLYARQRLLEAEAERLEAECEALVAANEVAAADRIYVLDVAARALREASTQLTAQISNILDRDLQR